MHALLPTSAPGIHELTASLAGGATLRYTLTVPPAYDATKLSPLVVALHYGGPVTPFYGRRMIDVLIAPALTELAPVIVAPDAPDADWTTPANTDAVVWLTRAVMQSLAIDARRVLLTGFSKGGQGTWHIGSRHQDLFTAAIPIAGRPADGPDWRVPVHAIHSRDDEIVPFEPTGEHVERLRAKGLPVELRELVGITHFETARYAEPLREAVPWLRRAWAS